MFLDMLWRYCFGHRAKHGTLNDVDNKGQSRGDGSTYHHMIQILEYVLYKFPSFL